jgi:hypothetical protein
MDRLARVFDADVGRIGYVLDEQTQIVGHVLARNDNSGRRLGAIFGNAIAEILVGVAAARFNFRQQLLRAIHVFQLL